MAQQTTDVIVIGGGVIGCAIAYYASNAGLRVIVLESTVFGGQGSSVAAGLVAPSPQIKEDGPFAQLALASLAYLPCLRDELREDTGIDIELDERGTLKVAANDGDAQEQLDLLPAKRKLGLDLRWLTANEVRYIEPGLAETISGAIYSPKEGQVSTRKLLSAYIEGANRHGARFLKRNAVNLLTHDAKVIGVQLTRGRIYAEHTIIASGAWASEQGQWLGAEIAIRPQRGQLVTLGKVKPALHHIIFWEDIYIAPKCAETITLGAYNDYAGFTQTPTVTAVMNLLSQGLKAAPSLTDARFIDVRAGLRPKTPDKLPIIGPIPGWKGVSIAAGHNSNGLLFSAMTGQMIAAHLTKRDKPMDTSPYQMSRFIHVRNIEWEPSW